MNNKTTRIRNLQKNPRLRALQLVRTMIEYRNTEISTLSRNLKRGIIHMHRQRSMKKHAEQYKELTGIIDQISRNIADNDYDINHLQIFLTQCRENVITPDDPEKTENLQDIHYIQ